MQHIRFKPMLPLLALVLAACSSPTETPVDPKVPPASSSQVLPSTQAVQNPSEVVAHAHGQEGY